MMARKPRDNETDPAAPPRPRRRRLRWRSLALFPATILALLGIAGLIPTIRSAPPPPPVRDPIRYPSGQGNATRLVVILAPQLGEREIPLLKTALVPTATETTPLLQVERPSFMSFEDTSLVLLAGNGPSEATPPAPADQPPDTLVRSVIGHGQRAQLIGPVDWRALFGEGNLGSPNPSPPPTASALIAETTAVLALRDASLVIVLLRDLAGRDLREGTPELRAALARAGAQLSAQDALLLIGGGGSVTGEPLRLSLSGAGTRLARTQDLDLNDVAPTCAALIGAAFPSEVRGRIAWGLLAADERRKATATAGLARQRSSLAVSAIPLGVPYPDTLRILINQHADVDAEIAAGRYDFAYQLAASQLEQADRQLGALAGATPIPPPRRAAWDLVIPCLATALLAILLVVVARAWGTLGASVLGGAAALLVWLAFVYFLRRVIVPNLATVVALTVGYALCGGALVAWLARHWSRPRPALAIDLLVLLTAFPAALCAYRYGLPWRLRLEEAAPLFLWRSALLAPIGLLVTGYGLLFAFSRSPRLPASTRRTSTEPTV